MRPGHLLLSIAAGIAASNEPVVQATPFPLNCARNGCGKPATHTVRIRAWSQFTKPAERTPANGVSLWCDLSCCEACGHTFGPDLQSQLIAWMHPRVERALLDKGKAGRYAFELDLVAIDEAKQEAGIA